MPKRQKLEKLDDYLRAIEPHILQLQFADDYGVLHPTIVTVLASAPDPDNPEAFFAAALRRFILNCVKIAESLLQGIVGENWKKSWQLRNCIEVERLREGLAREGKDLNGDVGTPDWAKQRCAELTNAERDYVVVCMELVHSAAISLGQLDAENPRPEVIGFGCMSIGECMAKIDLMGRSRLVEEGLKAKARPIKAANAKKAKASARHDELLMSYKNHLAQNHGMVMLAMKKTAEQFGVAIPTVRRARRKRDRQ
jgi:hypothetical protein